MKHVGFIIMMSLLLCCCSSNDDDNTTNPTTQNNQFTDSRDGQVYQLITLGTQIWFSENMNFEIENNQSTCYNNDAINCFSYGKLYRGDDVQTICPEGFHLPSLDEWQVLFDYLGGESTAYAFLGPYAEQQGTPINFNLLAGGYFHGTFFEIAQTGRYWTSTDGGYPDSFRYLEFEPNESTSFGGASFGVLMSCRCLKD